MTFKLDTSGFVSLTLDGKVPEDWMDGTAWTFASLSPFAQGYTAPILESVGAAFRDLAPETLARIIADCEAMFPVHFGGKTWTDEENRRAGRGAWSCRSAGRSSFPPQNAQLCDDGKVRFAA